MRYAIALLVVMAAGCSGKPEEVAPIRGKKVAAGLRDQAEKPQVATPDAKPIPQVATPDAKPVPRVEIPDPNPIPQDHAKMAAQAREALEWNLRTSVGAYDKVGKKDPRWDDLVRNLIEMAVRQRFDPDSKVTFADINQAAKAAVDAGCDDPLVGNIYVRAMNFPVDLGNENQLRLRRDATRAYAASRYPASRRAADLEAFASEWLNAQPRDDAARNEIEANLDASLALLPEGVKSEEHTRFWVNKWHNTLIGTIKDYRQIGVPAETAYERVDAKMANIPELEVMRLMVRGTFWLFYGWEARTHAFAPEVPVGGFRLLEERLAIAKEAYEEAWKLDPENAFAATGLIEIDKTVGGDRATMEMWFDRAMKADGNALDACRTKLDWLTPKWHGTPEEVIAFGRQCRDTKNWRAGITLLCAEAHWQITSLPGVNENTYLALPEVWADIQSVYDEYLKHYPTDEAARNKFALLCHQSAHYREAEVQYVALGDHIAQWKNFPYVPLNEMIEARERNAKIVMGQDGRITFPGWHFVRITNKGGQCHINTPVHAPHEEKPGILGADMVHVWNFSADGITYGIRALNLPPALRNESPEHVLDAARAVVAKERGAPPLNLRDTLLAARSAQEYDIDSPKLKPMRLRVKTIVIGDWLYELSVTGSKSDVTGPAAREFFDSFAYQPKAKPSPDAGGQ